MAQSPIVHAPAYTRPLGQLLQGGSAVHTNIPLISPKQVPMALLQSHNTMPSGAYARVPGVKPGSSDGIRPDASPSMSMEPEAFGNSSPQAVAPYTTARASAVVLGATPTAAAVAVTSYPWRATGKLYFLKGADQYVCSASLIGPGLLVTAAHCVFEFGANSAAGYHTNFVFVPAQNTAGATPPYGAWTAAADIIAPSYYYGTDTCYQKGVSCNNDVAVLVMAPDAYGRLPGNVVGYYGYAWDGYSFAASFGNASLASITQLGYPVAFDNGMMMERNDGVGSYWSPDGQTQQILLGSAFTGGSSGGPWLVNFGAPPAVTTGTNIGNQAVFQVVTGVTSWGISAVGSNTQGASWFGQNIEFPNASYPDTHGVSRGAGNIGALVASACSVSFASCF